MNSEIYFSVAGKVQGVMFRQTLIRAAQKRGLDGAASNLPDSTVSCYLSGPKEKIDDVLDGLKSGRPINTWGAQVTELNLLDAENGIAFQEHQVTTSNVDSFNWSAGVEMFL